MTLTHFLARRGLFAAVTVAAGCLVVAGCGGSSPHTSPNHKSAQVVTVGSRTLTLSAKASKKPDAKSPKAAHGHSRPSKPHKKVTPAEQKKLNAAAKTILATVQAGGSKGPTTTPPSPLPSSGSVLAAALVKAMAQNQPKLKNVKPACPKTLSKNPVRCSFTATDTSVGKQVSGTITVLGHYGTSYEYNLSYAPKH